jgi:hypothetical protein
VPLGAKFVSSANVKVFNQAPSHEYVSSTVDGGKCLASRLGLFNPGAHCIEGWVGVRSCLDDLQRKSLFLSGTETRFLPRSLETSPGHYTD